MKIKAVTNFAGAVTMHDGEIRLCEETETIRELIQAGYVEVLEPDTEVQEETDTKKVGKKK